MEQPKIYINTSSDRTPIPGQFIALPPHMVETLVLTLCEAKGALSVRALHSARAFNELKTVNELLDLLRVEI